MPRSAPHWRFGGWPEGCVLGFLGVGQHGGAVAQVEGRAQGGHHAAVENLAVIHGNTASGADGLFHGSSGLGIGGVEVAEKAWSCALKVGPVTIQWHCWAKEMRRAVKGGQFEEFGGMVVVKGGVME